MSRVLLVDDHLSFRQPLAFMLEREPSITVIGQAGTVAEALPLLPQADIALVDLELPDGTGESLIQAMKALGQGGKALVLTASGSTTALAHAVEAGAAGILHKSLAVDEVIAAIRRLEAGEPLLSPLETIARLRLVSQQRERDHTAQIAIDRLTRREHEVLQALSHGLHDREIGEQLHVSTETVRTHMVNILHKLGVDSRLGALVFAMRHRLVTID
jgi:DNA-binding NarL/FixJ family response regulator